MEDSLLNGESKALSLRGALSSLLLKSGPACASFFLQFSVEVINMFFLGNIDKYRLDGIGLGNMWGNVTGLAIGWGLAGGLDTLCSQAYGNKDFHRTGVWLQRGLFVLTAVMIPIAVGWWFTEAILTELWIDSQIAYYSGQYIRHVLPGLWFFLAFDCFRRFLQCQKYFWPCLLVNFITTMLHFLWCYLFIIQLDWLEVGAGVATSITYFLNFVLVLTIMYFGKFGKECWAPCDWTNFGSDIWKYLAFSVPAAAMQVIDSINFEITQLEAGLLGTDIQAAHTSILNTNALLWMISLGMGVSASAIIGNEVGAGNAKNAKTYAKACLIFVTATNVPIIILFFIFRQELASLYSYDEGVVDLIRELFIFMTTFNMLDAYQTVLMGICKGIGFQKWAAIIVLVAYYGFAMPLGYFLAFHTSLSIYGLWLGLMLGGILSVTGLTILVAKGKWSAKTLEDDKKDS